MNSENRAAGKEIASSDSAPGQRTHGMVTRHAIILNPALSVRAERYSVIEGRTPEISSPTPGPCSPRSAVPVWSPGAIAHSSPPFSSTPPRAPEPSQR